MNRYALLIPCLLLALALGAGPAFAQSGPTLTERQCNECQEAAKEKRGACYAAVDKVDRRRTQTRVETGPSVSMLKVGCGIQFREDQRACSVRPGCL